MLIATARTGLAGIPGVYFDYSGTTLLGFVRQEAMELCKTPTVKSALVLGVPLHRSTTTNVGQVLTHNGTTGWGILDNALTQDVVTIPVESQRLSRQLLKMPFSRFCSFGLQLAAEAKAAAVNLFPMTTTEEVT